MMGRKEANSAFLKALLGVDPFPEYHFFLPADKNPEVLQETLNALPFRPCSEARVHVRSLRMLPEALQQDNYQCLHLSDPVLHYVTAQILRNRYARAPFPVTAPVHSLSYNEMCTALLGHLWPGTLEQDAIIVTSHTASAVMQNFYTLLRRGYAMPAETFAQPSLEYVPLGVDHDAMPSLQERATLGKTFREAGNIKEDTVVFLVFARLSYQSKMDFLPILRACKAAEAIGMPAGGYHVALAGWSMESDHDFLQKYRELARNLGINISVHTCPTAEQKKQLYAAADVFLSPSDNMQETFGLTLLEAAASHLPVIASDYDGYKDLVRHGETGFLIRTIGPDAAEDSNWRSYALPAVETLALFAQQTVVDVEDMAHCMHALASNPTLRSTMGEAGYHFSLAFSWRSVVERYVHLWEMLSRRTVKDFEAMRFQKHPTLLDYIEIFGDYTSVRISQLADQGAMLRLSTVGEAVMRARDFPVLYGVVQQRIDPEKLHELLFRARKGVAVSVLLQCAAASAGDSAFLLLWAMKHGLLEVDRSAAP